MSWFKGLESLERGSDKKYPTQVSEIREAIKRENLVVGRLPMFLVA